ncbi:MAG: diaminopimelate epimerase [Bacteroidales bacterium]|nr:diaminopimelate epimerase [Bacteroidales bacterium]
MIYKFTGAGNSFVVLDGREGGVEDFRRPERIGELCREHGTDGLMILGAAAGVDFSMEFFNPDGSGGMMCGNGGRCITAFADFLGIRPASPDGVYHFLAPDGPHEARILEGPSDQVWTVRLKMIDVQGVTPMMDGYFLNTGTRHFVQFREGVAQIDMEAQAKPLRWDKAFQPEGTNVNFVEIQADGLHVRTYEKGVEGETLACGTGLTASAVAAFAAGIPGQAGDDGLRPGICYRLQCRRGDWLQVEFKPAGGGFKDVFLTGPAELLYAVSEK